jgi:hypothetical protein
MKRDLTRTRRCIALRQLSNDPGHAPGFWFLREPPDSRDDRRHEARMDTPTTDLQTLGRAFLDALLASLGQHGAAAVLLLLAAEIPTAEQRHRELLRNCAAKLESPDRSA